MKIKLEKDGIIDEKQINSLGDFEKLLIKVYNIEKKQLEEEEKF